MLQAKPAKKADAEKKLAAAKAALEAARKAVDTPGDVVHAVGRAR